MAFTPQQLSDREEIRDLLHRWALAVDTGDFETFEACYTADVVIDFKEIGYQGATGRGHREFVEKSAPNFRAMQHVLSNVIFVEQTETAARTRTMVTAATAGHDDVVFFIGAYYHDDLRKDARRLAYLPPVAPSAYIFTIFREPTIPRTCRRTVSGVHA